MIMTQLLLSFVVFCLGLAVGSFVNVVIIRGQKGETLGGRSKCAHCNAVLLWRELIPVLSFAIQKTRCQHCTGRISWQYPLVELACAAGYVLGFRALTFSSDASAASLPLSGFALALGIPAVLVILVSDLRFQTIPDGATFILAAIGLGMVLMRSASGYDLGAAATLAAILGGLWFFSRGQWMGFGDVKLVLATSLILGFPAAIAGFLFSFWSGGIVGALLLLAGKKQLHQRIPFGPFILLGSILAWFFSPLFFYQTGLGILW